VKRNRFNSW